MNRIARIAAIFYLLVFVTGFIELAMAGKYVVAGDPAATAANIMGHETTYRLSWLVHIAAISCYVVVTALFYVLFRVVGRSLSLTAALFSLMGCAVSAFGGALQLSPLVILKLDVFPPDQLQRLTYLFIRVNGSMGSLALVFFGIYCLLIGTLILSSRLLPHILGVLMVIAGLGWLTSGWGPLANALSPFNMIPGVIGEGALTFWLLVKGVREEIAHG